MSAEVLEYLLVALSLVNFLRQECCRLCYGLICRLSMTLMVLGCLLLQEIDH